MNMTQEQKNELKISSISELEISFKIGHSTVEIYDFKDGDYSIRLDDGNRNIEVILNNKQIEVIKRFLDNEKQYFNKPRKRQ